MSVRGSSGRPRAAATPSRAWLPGLVVLAVAAGLLACTAAPVEPPGRAGQASGDLPVSLPAPELDGQLATLLAQLRREVSRRDPRLVSARAVVMNFTAEGLPWSSPVAALIQERVARLVETGGSFRAVSRTRGITITQLAGIENPNEPKALTSLYGADLAIGGSCRWQRHEIVVELSAFDDQGRELAQVQGELRTDGLPEPVRVAEADYRHTGQFLNAFHQLGTRSHGKHKVEVTTNRPGLGATFRRGEEIRYFVISTADGYLYLFHMDAEGRILRIFPNLYQGEAWVRAGMRVEVPAQGAPFRFEASPPFGLETTLALVTPTPLDESQFQTLGTGFTRPLRDLPTLLGPRYRSVSPADPGAPGPPATPPAVWNTITVLVQP